MKQNREVPTTSQRQALGLQPNLRTGPTSKTPRVRLSLSGSLTVRPTASLFTISEIPYEEAQQYSVTSAQTLSYNNKIEQFYQLYEDKDYQGAVNLAHQLLYQSEIPLSISFSVSSLTDFASHLPLTRLAVFVATGVCIYTFTSASNGNRFSPPVPTML